MSLCTCFDLHLTIKGSDSGAMTVMRMVPARNQQLWSPHLHSGHLLGFQSVNRGSNYWKASLVT